MEKYFRGLIGGCAVLGSGVLYARLPFLTPITIALLAILCALGLIGVAMSISEARGG